MNATLKKSLLNFWFDPKGRAKLAGLYRSPFFWSVLVLKIVAGCLFASPYLSDLFIPFVDFFVSHPTENPYAHFLALGRPEVFPYPALMLYILALPGALAHGIAGDALPHFSTLALYRLPLLMADLGILAVLTRWLPGKTRLVLALYWASPVLFYITYLHGQLDVVPIALLFLALYALFKESLLGAAIALGLALSTKTHLAIALPFFLIYVWRRQESLKPCFAFLGMMAVAFLVPNIGHWTDPSFFAIVFHNVQQKKLAQAALSFSGDADYYLVLGGYLFLLFRSMQITLQNRDLFLMFLGFSFGALLLFIAPMPGWYFWIIPFFAYFFARNGGKQAILLWVLQGTYLLYFGLRPDSDFLAIFRPMELALADQPNAFAKLTASGASAPEIVNVAYTLLQTALIVNCALLYRQGIKGYQKHKLTVRSFLIGISGDSGSGKTTLAESLNALFTPRNVTIVCGDDMHKWQRGDSKWKELTHLDPRANELHQELNYLTALRQQSLIHRRHYDHTTGRFTEEMVIRPRPIVILEGLHSFYLKPARDLMDLKIFIQPDETLLLHRKVLRDTGKRGYPKEQVLDSIKKRAADAEKYIKVQKKNADIVIALRLKKPIASIGAKNEKPDLWLEITASNAFYFDPLLADLAPLLGKDLHHSYDTEDRQVIEIHGTVSRDVLESLGDKHIEGLQELGVYAPVWRDGLAGILQLFIAWCIFAKSRRMNLN